jgi:nickel-dependent lactate racemase
MAGTAVPQQDRLQVQVHYGLTSAEFTVHSQKLLRAADSQDDSATVEDVRAAVRQALEAPVDFPPLYRALTPDDRLAIVVNEYFRRLPDLLIPLLEHVQQAGVSLERITLLCPPRIPGVAPPPWREELPPAFAQVRVEEHDPGDRARLAYLAGTQGGRRLYLNRTLVEADQIIVAGPAEYDPVLGYGGGLGDLFPNLADAPTRQEFLRRTVEDLASTNCEPGLTGSRGSGLVDWCAVLAGGGSGSRRHGTGDLCRASCHDRAAGSPGTRCAVLLSFPLACGSGCYRRQR